MQSISWALSHGLPHFHHAGAGLIPQSEMRTYTGKPFLANFSQGARKLVITLCRAEMKQADRLHLIIM
jgi:hypothetical protein